MEKRFLIVNRGKDKYGLTYSHLSSGELISVNKNIHTLRNITDVGRETNNIILKNPVVFNTGDGFNDYVTDYEYLNDGGLIVIGAFTSYNDTPSNNIIKLNPDASIDSNFNIGTGLVGFLAFSGINHFLYDPVDNGFYLVGSFTSYNGISANGIIKLDQNGNQITSFNYGTGFQASYRVYGIMADTLSSSIFCHGIFTSYKGVGANFITKLLPDGSFDTGFVYGSGFNNAVTNLKVNADGSIICCGYFTTYKGVSSTRIIKIDRYGNKITDFNPGASFNNSVIYLNRDTGSNLYAYGYFTSYKGTVANRIVKIDINTGDIDLSFNYGSGFNDVAVAFFLNDDGTMYIGGNFTTYNSDPANHIIKLNPDGSQDFTFNTGTGFDNNVYGIGVKNGKVTITGEFTTYNGTTANNIIILNSDGSIYDGTEFTFLGGRAEYNIVDLDNTTDNEVLPKRLIEELIGDSMVIDVDYITLGDLILNKSLKKGFTYNLTTESPTNAIGLKSLYLKAIGNNLLSNNGHGIFYVPKYDTDNIGYGIWNNKMDSFTINVATGSFTMNEYVNGNNGSVGLFRANSLIECISGTWASTTLITGSSSGVTASVSGLVSPTYATGSNVIWGGKHWINKNGTLGISLDKYSLNSTSWREIEFNEFDYNLSLDEIKYDFDNNMIYYRKDKFNNEVSTTYNRVNIDQNDYLPSISDFQWGNGYYGNQITYYIRRGVIANRIINSYFDCLNSTNLIWYNNIDNSIIRNVFMHDSDILFNDINNSLIENINTLNGSALNSNIMSDTIISDSIFNISAFSSNKTNNSQIQNNIFYSSSMMANSLNISQISNNKSYGDSSISNNLLNNSVILNNTFLGYDGHLDYNVLDGSAISNNIFNATNSSYIVNNNLHSSNIDSNNVGNIELNHMIYGIISSNDIVSGGIDNNYMHSAIITSNSLVFATSSSLISRNNIQSSTISNMTFSRTEMVDNIINNSYFKLASTLTDKVITILSVEGLPNTALNLSTASVIFDRHPRTLYKRPDGSIRLRYYNNSDALVIGNYFI